MNDNTPLYLIAYSISFLIGFFIGKGYELKRTLNLLNNLDKYFYKVHGKRYIQTAIKELQKK